MNISLQECREAIAKNSGALLGADADFFNGVGNRFEGLKAKASHPADFRRLSADVRNWTINFTAKASWNADKDKPVYDGAMAWVAMIDREIENLVLASDHLGMQAATGDQWRNAKTGAAIKLYAPGEKIAGNASGNRVGIGEVLEGIVMGTKSESVRAALSSGTDAAGGYTVPLEITRDFIDKLRAKSVFMEAGARTMMLDGDTRIVRLTGDPSAAWREENASIGDSDITLDAVTLNPKSLSALVKVPYELLQDSVNVAEILTKALTEAMAAKLDYGCLFGSGTSPEIQGLFGTAGINTVSMGTNGLAPTSYDNMLDMLYELELDNAATPTAAIWHPRTARTFRKFKDANNNPLTVPSPLDVLPKLSTTAVPINQTQGSSSVASTVLMGDFSQAIFGLREQLTIIRLDQTYAGNGQIGFWARMRADVAFAHPESFCKLTGVLA